MSLLEELKQRLTAAYNTIDQIENRISDEQASLRRVAVGVTDLERAIAALEPAPAEPEAEPVAPDVEIPKGYQRWDRKLSDRWTDDALVMVLRGETVPVEGPVLARDVDWDDPTIWASKFCGWEEAPTPNEASVPQTDEVHVQVGDDQSKAFQPSPGSEENAGTNSDVPAGFTKWEGGEYPAADSDTIDVLYRNGNHEIFTPGMITDEDTWHHNDDELDIIAYRIISQPAESEEQPEPAEFISDLTGDPAIEAESGLHVWTAEELVQLSAKADAFIAEIGAPQVSVLDDPELIEAQKRLTARLEADTLAQVHSYWSDDVRAPPVPLQPEPTGYVGLQDKDLEADYDAMREREKADKPKLHFSIFGERGNRKLEDVE